ncbi:MULTISPECIES: GNAT family N-acetyltransferase [Methylocystis]|uniref:GCN5 family acetyltransferase n=1 Tax=Methylocystis iwaonis TaxID=2885079 RepID=A0ABN6VIK2_9HYPH|nr:MULTISPECIES: GNAT family N-acetyltransferase [Methylocystis]MBL1257256.1 GNAT family N-acetyltransferase [Methylocystis sp. Sn-Cys]BDV34052.1 GCN5 family acetyltransferase [Methylocystis iwaonis]
MAQPGLRPYLASDAAALAALFRASIEALAAEDYDADQREAWASAADDEAAFAARLAGALTIVALADGEIAGFASLKDNKLFDMLYVRPDYAGQGVGAALADAIEKLAGARGTKTLTVEASDTARDFFAARGYVAQSRNTVTIAGEWLGNTTMTKQLAAPPAAGGTH